MDFWIGFGFDVYWLVDGRKCIFGGVYIFSDFGLFGYFDVDVLFYVICDVLFGVFNFWDIGFYFFDCDL